MSIVFDRTVETIVDMKIAHIPIAFRVIITIIVFESFSYTFTWCEHYLTKGYGVPSM